MDGCAGACVRVFSNSAVAGVAEGGEREGDQSCGDDREQERAAGGVREFRQRTVEANGFVWVVVD